MAVEIHPAAREHLADIAQLLREAFGVPPGAYFLDPDLLAWKYFTGPADAALPRSYILRHGGRAVAHCGAVPLTLASPGDGNFSNTDLAFRGDYVFVGNYQGFTVYDISTPAAPALVGSAPLANLPTAMTAWASPTRY